MAFVGKFNKERITAAFIICVLLFLVYAGIKVINLVNVIQNVQASTDTGVFIKMASKPIWSTAFLCGSRPFTVPLLYKLFNSNFILIAIFQTIFSLLSWSFLAFQISKTIHSIWLKIFAFTLVLLFSLSENIIGWDSVMLSESISLSLMALFLAGWLWLLSGWKWQKVIFLVVIAFLWTFSRESNAWIILMVAGITTLIAVWKRSYRRYLIIAGIFFIFFGANEVSSNIGRRWEFPFLNVIAQRILPDKENTSFFSKNGMPVTPALTRRSGQWASSENWAFYRDPALEKFRVWLHNNGKSCYIRWLLSRPYQTLKEPISNRQRLLTFEGRNYFFPGFSPVLPTILDSVIYPNDHLSFVILILLSVNVIAIGLTIVARAYRYNPVWVVLLSMSLLVYPHAFLVWHGDAMEIGRHSLQVGVQLYLCMWILILLTMDHILAAKSRDKGG